MGDANTERGSIANVAECRSSPHGLYVVGMYARKVWTGLHGVAPAQLGEGTLRVLAVNSNGLRKRNRLLALGRILTIVRVRACVVTESHLRNGDFRRIKIPGYVIVAHFCRRAKNIKIGGGVLI